MNVCWELSTFHLPKPSASLEEKILVVIGPQLSHFGNELTYRIRREEVGQKTPEGINREWFGVAEFVCSFAAKRPFVEGGGVADQPTPTNGCR